MNHLLNTVIVHLIPLVCFPIYTVSSELKGVEARMGKPDSDLLKTDILCNHRHREGMLAWNSK